VVGGLGEKRVLGHFSSVTTLAARLSRLQRWGKGKWGAGAVPRGPLNSLEVNQGKGKGVNLMAGPLHQEVIRGG